MLLDRTTSQPVDLIIGGKRKDFGQTWFGEEKMAVQIVGRQKMLCYWRSFPNRPQPVKVTCIRLDTP